jgi:hypothetical protein
LREVTSPETGSGVDCEESASTLESTTCGVVDVLDAAGAGARRARWTLSSAMTMSITIPTMRYGRGTRDIKRGAFFDIFMLIFY